MDAYRSHLETAHFKKYKATTEKMVKSLKLVQAAPIMLGTNASVPFPNARTLGERLSPVAQRVDHQREGR